jgi:hypothetical protein
MGRKGEIMSRKASPVETITLHVTIAKSTMDWVERIMEATGDSRSRVIENALLEGLSTDYQVERNKDLNPDGTDRF